MIKKPSTDPQACELELSPYICSAVVELCANHAKDYLHFNSRMQKLIDDVAADLKREPSGQSQALLDELKFTIAFIAKKVMNEYCEAA